MTNSSLAVQPYDLPDSQIINSPLDFDYRIWIPETVCIVLGRSNTADNSLLRETVLADKVPIYKRPSGGEAVILTPYMIVFSIRKNLTRDFKPHTVFSTINRSLITEFVAIGMKDVCHRGISDLSIKEMKIMGSSMYVSHSAMFYHAVININQEVSIISKYLTHPCKEPEYRNGRNHEDFVTSIHKAGYLVKKDEMVNALENACRHISSHI